MRNFASTRCNWNIAAAHHPQLARAAEELAVSGLLSAGFGEAQALLTRLLVLLRLVAPDSAVPPEPAQVLVANALGFKAWPDLMKALDAAKGTIGTVWNDYKENAT